MVDDDPLPTLTIADRQVSETAGSVVLTVTKTGATSPQVTVSYSTTAGTATAGADFASQSGTLDFLPAETTKTITVAIVNDTLEEFAEQFTVSLSAPVDATVGGPATIWT